MSEPNRICFIIMPFGKQGTDEYDYNLKIYRLMIKPVLELCNYKPIRADDLKNPGSITHDIIELLNDADVVIADLSGKNANVFYELGVRHVLYRYGTIPIIRKGENIPFDIAQYRVIFYSSELDGPEQFKIELEQWIKSFEKSKSQKTDNPVHHILGDFIGIFGKTAVTIEKYDELQIFVKELEDANKRLNEQIDREDLGGYEADLTYYKDLVRELEKQNKKLNNENNKLIGKNELLNDLLKEKSLRDKNK